MTPRCRRRKPWLTVAALLVTGALVVSVATAGAERWLAYAIVYAPNNGKSIDPADDPPAGRLAELGVDRHLRVRVGPPPASLSVWIVEPASPAADTRARQGSMDGAASVLMLHGIRDEKASMLSMGQKLSAAGFRAVLVDLRGHGRSSGDFLTYGVVEARDLSQLLDTLVAEGLAGHRVGVLAPSYGGAVAIQLAARDRRVRAVVAAATFTSLSEIVPVYVRRFLPAWLVADTFFKQALERAGRIASFNPSDADCRRAVARTRARVLLIHSRTDEKIPYHHSQTLYRAAGERAGLTLLPEGDHNSVLSNPQAKAASIEWLDKWLK